MNTITVQAIIPSWEGVDEADTPPIPSYIVEIAGAYESVAGGTSIKKNNAPTHDNDYDARCNSEGELSGEYPLSEVTKVYIWGYGYSLNGKYYECEPIYKDAAEIEISEDTELILWGANSV